MHRVGAMDVTQPYKFIRFWAMDVTKPYKFIGFGAVCCTGIEIAIGEPDWSVAILVQVRSKRAFCPLWSNESGVEHDGPRHPYVDEEAAGRGRGDVAGH